MGDLGKVSVRVVPDLSDFQDGLTAGVLAIDVMADTKAKVDAGAALTFAMFHVRREDVDWIKAMPAKVMHAYQRACTVYGVDSRQVD
jgi:hypothetical protein